MATISLEEHRNLSPQERNEKKEANLSTLNWIVSRIEFLIVGIGAINFLSHWAADIKIGWLMTSVIQALAIAFIYKIINLQKDYSEDFLYLLKEFGIKQKPKALIYIFVFLAISLILFGISKEGDKQFLLDYNAYTPTHKRTSEDANKQEHDKQANSIKTRIAELNAEIKSKDCPTCALDSDVKRFGKLLAEERRSLKVVKNPKYRAAIEKKNSEIYNTISNLEAQKSSAWGQAKLIHDGFLKVQADSLSGLSTIHASIVTKISTKITDDNNNEDLKAHDRELTNKWFAGFLAIITQITRSCILLALFFVRYESGKIESVVGKPSVILNLILSWVSPITAYIHLHYDKRMITLAANMADRVQEKYTHIDKRTITPLHGSFIENQTTTYREGDLFFKQNIIQKKTNQQSDESAIDNSNFVSETVIPFETTPTVLNDADEIEIIIGMFQSVLLSSIDVNEQEEIEAIIEMFENVLITV